MPLRYLYSLVFVIMTVLTSYGLEKEKQSSKTFRIFVLNVFINKIPTGDQIVYLKKKIFMYPVPH